jgi:hypothetical protein
MKESGVAAQEARHGVSAEARVHPIVPSGAGLPLALP